jgi:hypothetical protein
VIRFEYMGYTSWHINLCLQFRIISIQSYRHVHINVAFINSHSKDRSSVSHVLAIIFIFSTNMRAPDTDFASPVSIT